MYTIEKFKNLPEHQALLNKVAKVITEDPRVIGLYVYGSQEADEYSDIDLSIFFKSDEERESFRNDIEEISQKIGKVKAGTTYFPDTEMYIVIFDPEEIKIDINFMLIYKDDNPYENPVDIIYDPEGHLEQMIKDAPKLVIDIDKADLDRRVKTFYVGLNYTIKKIWRGDFWRALDVIDIYRRGLLQFEDIFAQRLQKDYLEVEKNLNEERIVVLNKTLISELTQKSLFDGMNAIFEYFNRF